MFSKTIAVLCVLALPVSLSFWHKSHKYPAQHRYDLTAYKSMWVYLRDGVCGISVLSMPTKAASRTQFHATMGQADLLKGRTFHFSSTLHEPYRETWIIFPLWLPAFLLAGTGAAALFVGPLRRWHRLRTGCCIQCGYSLQGNRSGRCPECGTPCGSGSRGSTSPTTAAPAQAGPRRYRL